MVKDDIRVMEKNIISALLKRPRFIPARNLSQLEGYMFTDAKLGKLFDLIKYDEPSYAKLKNETGFTLAQLMVDMQMIEGDVVTDEYIQTVLDNYYTNEFHKIELQNTDIKNKYSAMSKVISKMNGIYKSDSSIIEYEKFERIHADGARRGILGITTGFKAIDKITFGLIPSHIWVVGGYYGSGKSYFGLNIASNMIDVNAYCAIYTLEMSSNECIQRLIGLRALLSPLAVLRKQADVNIEECRITAKSDVLKAIEDSTLYINDSVRKIEAIETDIRRLASVGRLNVVIIDYIQLVAEGKDLYESLSSAVVLLQQLAKELGITIIMISQINNQAQAQGKEAGVDGFKGAGEIGQVANVAIRIYRYKDDAGRWTDAFDLDFVKVRHNCGDNLKYKIKFPGGRLYEPNSADINLV